MGSIWVSDQVEEFLKGHSDNNESMDATLRRLLKIKKDSREYIPKHQLLNRGWFIKGILDSFTSEYSEKNADEPRRTKEIRDYVAWELSRFNPDDFPKDFELTKNGQPRWKNRFNSALNYLVEKKVLIKSSQSELNWKGGEYTVNIEHEDMEQLYIDIQAEIEGDIRKRLKDYDDWIKET